MMRLDRCGPVALAALALLLPAVPGAAQQASPFLPEGHWSLEAVRRLDAAGATGPGVDPVSRSMTVGEAIHWLDRVATAATAATAAEAATATGTAPAWGPRVRAYRERLAAELGWPSGESLGRWDAGVRSVHGSAFVGYAAVDDALEPGSGSWGLEDWSGPIARPDTRGVRTELRVAADAGPFLAGAASVATVGSAMEVEEAYVTSGVGVVGLWLGRRPMGYRVGEGGGLVLDRVRVDGLGLFLRRPIVLPVVGAVRVETDLSRLDDNGWIGEPWLWSSRASVQPHPRLALGATRAIMFGGEGNEPVTLRNVLYMLVGKHGGSGSGFENQVASVDVRYRPPLPAPVLVRLEWGFDDSAGAWFDQPGWLAGVELVSVPGLPALSLGLEHTRIAGAVEGHSIWYRHWWFHDGWVNGDASLGHPLGGHGREWLLYGVADLVEEGVRVDGRIFLRNRGDYNLFAPARSGSSRAASLELEWRLARQLEVVVGAHWEEGESDWRETSLSVGGRLRAGLSRP